MIGCVVATHLSNRTEGAASVPSVRQATCRALFGWLAVLLISSSSRAVLWDISKTTLSAGDTTDHVRINPKTGFVTLASTEGRNLSSDQDVADENDAPVANPAFSSLIDVAMIADTWEGNSQRPRGSYERAGILAFEAVNDDNTHPSIDALLADNDAVASIASDTFYRNTRTYTGTAPTPDTAATTRENPNYIGYRLFRASLMQLLNVTTLPETLVFKPSAAEQYESVTDGSVYTEWNSITNEVAGRQLTIDLGQNRIIDRIVVRSGISTKYTTISLQSRAKSVELIQRQGEGFLRSYVVSVAPEDPNTASGVGRFVTVLGSQENTSLDIDSDLDDGIWRLWERDGSRKNALGRFVQLAIIAGDRVNPVMLGEIEVYGVGFDTEGSYSSELLSAPSGEPVNVGRIRWETNVPDGTDITFQFRSSDSPDDLVIEETTELDPPPRAAVVLDTSYALLPTSFTLDVSNTAEKSVTPVRFPTGGDVIIPTPFLTAVPISGVLMETLAQPTYTQDVVDQLLPGATDIVQAKVVGIADSSFVTVFRTAPDTAYRVKTSDGFIEISTSNTVLVDTLSELPDAVDIISLIEDGSVEIDLADDGGSAVLTGFGVSSAVTSSGDSVTLSTDGATYVLTFDTYELRLSNAATLGATLANKSVLDLTALVSAGALSADIAGLIDIGDEPTNGQTETAEVSISQAFDGSYPDAVLTTVFGDLVFDVSGKLYITSQANTHVEATVTVIDDGVRPAETVTTTFSTPWNAVDASTSPQISWRDTTDDLGRFVDIPEPKRFLQFRALFTTDDLLKSASLGRMKLAYDTEIVADSATVDIRVYSSVEDGFVPEEVDTALRDAHTLIDYRIALVIDSTRNRGVDRVELLLPTGGSLVVVSWKGQEIAASASTSEEGVMRVDLANIIEQADHDTLSISLTTRFFDDLTVIPAWIAQAADVAEANVNPQVVGGRPFVRAGGTVPKALSLELPLPNPFTPNGDNINDAVKFVFTVTQVVNPTPLTVHLFDLRGRRVATILDEMRSPARAEWEWDGRDSSGQLVQPGLYIYRARLDADVPETVVGTITVVY